MNRATERCVRLAEQLNLSSCWGLNADTCLHYAHHITTLFPHITDLSDAHLRIVLTNYHLDHRLVLVLRDRHHPDHAENWDRWSHQAVRILAAKLRHATGVDLATMSLEDLSQEAMYDLWQALCSFRYESRFTTWAFTIVSNCVARAFRSAQTHKRRAPVGAISLDPTPETAGAIAEPQTTPLEDVALGTSLATLSQEVLAKHPDVRLRVIFYLWVHEDQPLRVIGDRLNLSVPRVHALLSHALSILRNETAIQDWACQPD